MAANNNNGDKNTASQPLDWSQSQDPYTILGLSRSTTITEKELKRKYRQLALKYHPDMTTTLSSTPQEKQFASDQFTKINQAYQTLLNQLQQQPNNNNSRRSSSSSSSSSDTKWEPPHRRTRSSSTSSSSSSSNDDCRSTDWRDFMPNNDDDTSFDTNGDSFGQIFSDLFQGTVASTVVNGGGILQDFIEFLELNVDGYRRNDGSSSNNNINNNDNDDDAELRRLLQMGTKQDIANEMEESELVVQQLTNKLKKVSDEMAQIQFEISSSSPSANTNDSSSSSSKATYRVRLEYQERQEELQSQLQIVERYLQRARYRYSQLQNRYKELLSTTTTQNTATSGSSNTSSTDTEPNTQGFQSSFSTNRGRGSSRRRSTATSSSSSSASSSSSSSQPPPPPDASSSSSTSSTTTTLYPPPQQWDTVTARPTPNTDYDATVPPHRRTGTSTKTSNKSFAQQMEEDKQRLREIKVDEAFDQLKRDLGL